MSWSEEKGLSCHRLSLPCSIAEQQKADECYPILPIPSPGLWLMSPIIGLKSSLPRCADYCSTDQVQGGTGSQDSCNSRQGGSFHLKGKIARRLLHGPIPSNRCICWSCSPPQKCFDNHIFSWKWSSLYYSSVPPSLFQGSLVRVCLNMNSAYTLWHRGEAAFFSSLQPDLGLSLAIIHNSSAWKWLQAQAKSTRWPCKQTSRMKFLSVLFFLGEAEKAQEPFSHCGPTVWS